MGLAILPLCVVTALGSDAATAHARHRVADAFARTDPVPEVIAHFATGMDHASLAVVPEPVSEDLATQSAEVGSGVAFSFKTIRWGAKETPSKAVVLHYMAEGRLVEPATGRIAWRGICDAFGWRLDTLAPAQVSAALTDGARECARQLLQQFLIAPGGSHERA